MDLIVIWLLPVLGRCNSFSFNGLTQLYTKWSEMRFGYNISALSNERLVICVIFKNFSFFFILFSNQSATMLCGETFFIIITVAILFVVSRVWIPVRDKGMALLWLGSFVPALHWGTSQQCWTHLDTLGVEGRKQTMCAQHRQTFRTWLISPYPGCANPGCCKRNGDQGSKAWGIEERKQRREAMEKKGR